jgi:hypothetical protein
MSQSFEFAPAQEEVPTEQKAIVETNTIQTQSTFRIQDLQEEMNRIDAEIVMLQGRKASLQVRIDAAVVALNIEI